MKICRKCNVEMPNVATINGIVKNISNRKFCLGCSPYGSHNTKSDDPARPTINRKNRNHLDNISKYNWEEIQKEHDNGKTWNELTQIFGVCSTYLAAARKCNKLKTRTKLEAAMMSIRPHLKHTEETKQKLSKIRIKHLKDHPDQVPYLLNHSSKGESYPEKYFTEVFQKENIVLTKQYQIDLYSLDFCNIEKKLYIEIDGEQHYVDDKIVASDIKRSQFLSDLGWKSYRIRWSYYTKLSFEEKNKIIQNIKNFINTGNTTENLIIPNHINKKDIKNKCKICGNLTKSYDRTYCSGECRKQDKTSYFHKLHAPKEELEALVDIMPMTEIGKIFNVSSNTIKKRCVMLGIKTPIKKHYWPK